MSSIDGREEGYVHGYSEREAQRLRDQANTLAGLLHTGVVYPAGSTVLEAGCGAGCQTVFLAANSPGAHITSMDISPDSLARAEQKVVEAGFTNVVFRQGDIMCLDIPEGSFDHVFVCFVLEHLADPVGALERLRCVLKPGGTITVIEGDHGSFYCYPETEAVRKAVQCLVDVQASLGGNSLIGRQLYPLVAGAGFKQVQVTPCVVYADDSRPDWVEGFSKLTFTAMVEGVREQALAQGLIDLDTWEAGIRGLYRATEADGVFNYTFFRAVGVA